jgi:hypothetical protein
VIARWAFTTTSAAVASAALGCLIAGSPLHHTDFWASFWPGLWIVGVVLAAVGVLLGITSGRGRVRAYGVLGGLIAAGALFFAAVGLIFHGVSGEL